MERTVGNNRLVDGAKLDAIVLTDGKINVNSIGNGNITNAEFNALDGVTSNIQEQINDIGTASLSGDTNKVVGDNINSSGTPSYDGTCVLITAGNVVTRYCPTYIAMFVDGYKVSQTSANGTYDSLTKLMTYDNGISVNSETGEIKVSDKKISYTNSNNSFEEGFTNIFNGGVVFNGPISTPFKDLGTTSGGINFNGNLSLNQKVTISGSGSHILNFNNMLPTTYVLFIVQEGTGTLDLGIVSDSGTVTGISSINEEPYPKSLSTGSHIFVITVANVKVHIGYVGISG